MNSEGKIIADEDLAEVARPLPAAGVRLAGPPSGSHRSGARLRRGGQFRQHPQSLRIRLETFLCLVPTLPPPHPQTVGLYITACASGSVERGAKPNSVSTIERRLSSISWNYAQRGLSLDRKDRHIATVMAGIRNSHARPPVQKEAVMATDIIAMLETIDRGTLRGMRDRAMLLIGYAGGLRRSEIVCLDLKADQTEDGRGWIEILDKGMLVTLRGKTGWREVEIGRGSSDNTCPVLALQTWIKYAKLAHGPSSGGLPDKERPLDRIA